MKEKIKEQNIKSVYTLKNTKEVPGQNACENGKVNKIIPKKVSNNRMENWLIAESKYRGFYV
jgi:hypothetical protein